MKKLIIILLLSVCQFSYAQWELLYSTSPSITVASFAVSGDYIFAGANNTTRGIYLSTDKGQTWTNKGKGLDIKPLQVKSIAISGDYVFAATADSGVYRSGDWGDSWEKVINGLDLLDVNSVATSGGNVFAGTNGAGMFFSSDNGDTWLGRNDGLPNLTINTIAIEEENIFIGTKGDGIYFSSNLGNDWIAKNSGLETQSDSVINSIDIEGNNVIAGTENGISLSSDLGENWVQHYPTYGGHYGGSEAVVLNGNTIYALENNEFVKSTDMGNEWIARSDNGLIARYTEVYKDIQWVQSIKLKGLALADDNTVLAGAFYQGIFRSTNGGDYFYSKSILDYKINSMIISGENMFVTSYMNDKWNDYSGGIYRSTNAGNSWRSVGFRHRGIWSAILKEDTLFALQYNQGIFFSTDLGNTWQVKDTTSLPTAGFRNFVIDGDNWVIASTSGVIRSTDAGNTWQTKNDGLVDVSIYSVAKSGNNIFAGCRGKGIYLSTDFGDTWEYKGLDGLYVYEIKISGNYIFAGTNDGFYRSTDYGDTWELKYKNNISPSTNAFELYEGNVIIGISGNNSLHQVLVSTDMGESWTKKDETMESSDASISNPLSAQGYFVDDFTIGGEYMYAVVGNSSLIFRAKLSDLFSLTSVSDETTANDIMIYPNPTSDFIEINYKISDGIGANLRDSDELHIFDILGTEVSHSLLMDGINRINVSHLPAGMYFIKVGSTYDKFIKQR